MRSKIWSAIFNWDQSRDKLIYWFCSRLKSLAFVNFVRAQSNRICRKYFSLPYPIPVADQYGLGLKDHGHEEPVRYMLHPRHVSLSSIVLEATAGAFSGHHCYLDGISILSILNRWDFTYEQWFHWSHFSGCTVSNGSRHTCCFSFQSITSP